jgi:hypothetical protein
MEFCRTDADCAPSYTASRNGGGVAFGKILMSLIGTSRHFAALQNLVAIGA